MSLTEDALNDLGNDNTAPAKTDSAAAPESRGRPKEHFQGE